MMRRISGPSKGRSASATVELAVLAPFLVPLLLAVIDLGRLFYCTMTVENCLHNAMLFSGQTFNNQQQQWIGTTQYWQGPSGSLTTTQAAGELDSTNLTPALADSQITTSSTNDSDGNSVVVVTVTYTFTPLIAYPGLPSSVAISRSAQIRVAPALPK
jgi:hypothetical protein